MKRECPGKPEGPPGLPPFKLMAGGGEGWPREDGTPNSPRVP